MAYKTMLDASRGGKTSDTQERAHYDRLRNKADAAIAAKGNREKSSKTGAQASQHMRELFAKAVEAAPERQSDR